MHVGMVGLLKWTSAHPHPQSHPSSMSLSSSKIAIHMRKLRAITRTECAYTAYMYVAYHRPMFLLRWVYYMRAYMRAYVWLHFMRACLRARLFECACVRMRVRVHFSRCIGRAGSERERDLHTSVEINRIAVKKYAYFGVYCIHILFAPLKSFRDLVCNVYT